MAASSSSSSVSGSRGSSSSGPAAGFKVYGSVFKVSSRYQFLNPLGKGSYGVVCAAKDRETGQCVAIKKVSPMAKRTVDAKHTLREVLLLQFLGKHPNIISIHNLSTNLKDDELYIVMDLMDTDMHRVIQSTQPLSDAHAKYFLHQLLRGVKYLHDNGVLHRDLKPGNLLLSKTCQLKIADFGLARKIPRLAAPGHALERPRSAPAASSSASSRVPDRPPMTEHVVTRWYRAPELMLQPDGLYDQSVDMWSVGCIFAEILGRKALFPGKNFLHQLTLIFEVLGAPSLEASTQIHSSQAQRFLRSLGKKPKVPFRTLFPNASDAAVDLLDRLLEFDPAKRISAQEALAHPYMQDIERKYRHRGGGVDPPAPMRVDFSFDSKNLTKMDLRALIVKEVDNLRKTSATRGSATATESASATNASEDEERRQRHADGEKKGIGLVSSDSAVASTPGEQAGILTSSGGLSKIHAALRQAQAQDQQHQQEKLVASAHQRQLQAVMFGSNRQRIRGVSKPPVPRQQSTGVMWGSTSNQHEHVRVVAAQASLLSNRSTTRLTPAPDTESTAINGNATRTEGALTPPLDSQPSPAAAVPGVTKFEVSSSSRTVCEGPKVHVRPALSVRTPVVQTIGPETEASETRPKPDLVPVPKDLGESDPPDAIAAAIALGQRSKALIASLATSARTPDPILVSAHSRRVSTSLRRAHAAWQSSVGRNPEPTPSSSSSSSPSSSSDSETSRHRTRQGFSAASRPDSAILLTRSRINKPEDVVPATTALGRPRRISSAGPVRSKPRQLSTAGSLTARSSGTTTTFVGSTNSLIRAQRANGGLHQTLAASANNMLATISRNNEERSPSGDSREEDATEPGSLIPQRSTARLPGQDPTNRKLPTKRLTVPKSPKFSVMSWQKKREGSRGALGATDARTSLR